MPAEPIERTVTIVNTKGLHVRAATTLAKTASRFASNVTIAKDGQRIDTKSIMGLLMLTAARGSEVTVAATGGDAREAVDTVAALIESGFGEKA